MLSHISGGDGKRDRQLSSERLAASTESARQTTVNSPIFPQPPYIHQPATATDRCSKGVFFRLSVGILGQLH